MLSRCSQASKPFCQKRSKMPESCHSLKRRCAELDEHIPVAFRQPVLRKKNMASMAARLSTRFLYVSSGWLVLCSGIPGHFLGSMQKNNEVSILSLQAFHSLKLLGQSETGDCSNFLQAKTCSNLKVRGRMIKIHEDRTEIIH